MYCEKCGAQVQGAFCTACGARVGQPFASSPAPPPGAQAPPPYSQPQPPPVTPSYSQPLPPPAKSGSGLKILFVVLGVMGVLGMLFVGALMYGWHKVKQAAQSRGVDLNSFTETRQGPARRLDACALLTKDDLSQILGMPIDRAEGGSPSSHSACHYYSTAAPEQASNAAAEEFRKMQEASQAGTRTADQEEAMRRVGKLMRGMVGAASNGLVVSIDIETDNAKAAMAAFKLAMGAMTAGMPPDAHLREEIQGVGDEAVIGPLASMFIFRKGDVTVTIDGRTLPGGKDTEVAIAKRIISRL